MPKPTRVLKILVFLLAGGMLTLTLFRFAGLGLPVLHFSIDLTKFLRLILILLDLGVLCAAVFYVGARGSGRASSLNNIILIPFSLVVAFLFLEGVFMYVPRTHSAGNVALANQIWVDRYWKPINRMGFRDKDVSDADLQSDDLILVLGDSFASGYGIKDIRDRFSDQLEARLGDHFRVLNMGVNGFSTRDEIGLLFNYLQRKTIKLPKAIILSYYGNDIMEPREIPRTGYGDLSDWQKYLVERSYFFNFVYWSFEHKETLNYVDSMQAYFEDPARLKEHIKEIETLYLMCKDKSVRLAVVIFPFMTVPEQSEFYTNLIGRVFAKLDVPVVDVASLIKDIPVKKRIVNTNDHHASVSVNHLIAERLEKIVVEMQLNKR